MKSLDYHKSICYFRNGFVPFKKGQLSIASSPVLYGLSVYTVFNAVWSKEKNTMLIFRLQDHWLRLCKSAKIMGFEDFSESWPFEKFEKTMKDLLIKNKIKENVLVRACIFIDELIAGTKISGLTNSFSAYVYPMNQFYPKQGINVCVSSWRRVSDEAIPNRAKVNGSYANASLMKNEALLNGYNEAIAIDDNGHVAEGTVANIFLVREGKLITPDNSTDILEGITRDTVFSLAGYLNIPIESRPVDRSELYIADELFFSGSSARITGILSVDKRKIGTGKFPITEQIFKAYELAQFGKLDNFSDWITNI